MGKIFRRKGLAFFSGVLCLLAASVVVTVIINDPHKPETRPWSAWVQVNFTRTIQVNGVRQVLAKTGWTYFGLFKGYKEKSYSGVYKGLRKEYFKGPLNSLVLFDVNSVEWLEPKMGKTCRRNSLFFFSGLLALVGIAIITYAFISEAWVFCKVTRTLNKDKKNENVYDAVFEEFENVFNLKILYAVIGCLVVAGIFLLVCAGLSFYNEFTKSSYVVLGSLGLYVFNAVAFFLMICAVGLFSGLYHQQIKKNVLTEDEKANGFNSENMASLEFSFWILVGACFLPLINMLLTFLNSARAKSYFNKATTISTSNVDGMMLY